LKLKNLTVGLLYVCLFVGCLFTVKAFDDIGKAPQTNPFSPSNARTEDGRLIPAEQFFPASRCASCHADTHKGWSQSLHRNAAREPFYRESADILLRTRGIELTRHCESCHTPVALFSGALSKTSGRQEAPFTDLDDEGVTCSVCHSISEARLDGTGSFTIRRPALLAQTDGTPIYGNFSDAQILADVPAHKRAVMRPLLKQPEFCSTCHKVDAPPELNNYKHIRGFSAYDEWQQSGASGESVLPFYQREKRTDCRACHMPKIESLNDRAAKNGRIASHRWLGANTAAPLFYGQSEQVELTRQFLQNEVIDLDIFALKSAASDSGVSAMENRQSLALNPGEPVTVEVVVSNRNAAHSFPPEVRDLYEAWVEFEALDEKGETVFHSGFLKADGMLDERAHVYKAILLDESGRHITRHQIWTTNIKVYDNAIQAGRSDIARFHFRLPDWQTKKALRAASLTLRARLNYRRVNQEYTNYILKQRKATLKLPVIKMAEAETQLWLGRQQGGAQAAAIRNPVQRALLSATRSPQWKRWNDYGIGLLEQAQYGAAALAFGRASGLAPDNPSLLVNAAIAEMRTERFGPQREQLQKAAALLEQALKMAPANLRARYVQALVLRGQGNLNAAAETLAEIARQYPRDREVQRQLGQTFYSLGRLLEARAALEAILAIDPTDALAYQLLSPLYASEGRKAEANRALALYYQWRDDPRADAIGARFFAAHPEWAEERMTGHGHGKASPSRPVLTGLSATPER
jgi:Flp pilus assembly protein TadD